MNLNSQMIFRITFPTSSSLAFRSIHAPSPYLEGTKGPTLGATWRWHKSKDLRGTWVRRTRKEGSPLSCLGRNPSQNFGYQSFNPSNHWTESRPLSSHLSSLRTGVPDCVDCNSVLTLFPSSRSLVMDSIDWCGYLSAWSGDLT